MDFKLNVILELLQVKKAISFRTKAYGTMTMVLQVNSDKTFQYNYTSETNNIVISGLTIKEFNKLVTTLRDTFGYKQIQPIDYPH